MSRPSKFSDEIKEKIKFLARKGLTDTEMATMVDVTERTFNNWKTSYPEFFQSLKDWKAEADEKIERSLYERAHGYYHPETKAQWVQDKEGGRWEYAEMVKHYPPDPTSMIFWLKNRQPDKWRDKQQLDVNIDKVKSNIRQLLGKLVAGRTSDTSGRTPSRGEQS